MSASPFSQLWVSSRRNSIHLFGGNIDDHSYLAFQHTPFETFWPLVVLAIGTAETSPHPHSRSHLAAMHTLGAHRVPGDFEWDPLGLYPSDPEEQIEMKTKESSNAHLAMIGIAGMVFHELVLGGKLF